MLVNDGIDFNDLEASHATVVGDDLHSEVSLSVRSPAAYRSPDARRVFRIDPVHVEGNMVASRTAPGSAQRFFHYCAHAALVDVAHRVHLGDTGTAYVFFLRLIDVAHAD